MDLCKLVQAKWSPFLPLNYKLEWHKLWRKGRDKKAFHFILLSMWHKSIAINLWRTKVNSNGEKGSSILWNILLIHQNIIDSKNAQNLNMDGNGLS
jgi:hypothetical protein